MYNKVLSGILVVLIIAIIGVLGYFGYGYYKKITLNADAKEYLEEFDTLVVELSKEQEKDFDAENQSNENNSNNSNGTNNTTMRGIATDKLVYKGFTVVGK